MFPLLMYGEMGPAFQVNPGAPIGIFLAYLEATVNTILLEKAAEHYQGKGLYSGPAEVSFKLLKSYRKQALPEKIGMLECILCAGY